MKHLGAASVRNQGIAKSKKKSDKKMNSGLYATCRAAACAARGENK